MKFELPKLPYSVDALAPFISAETLEFHHERHHRGYVDKLNELVVKTPLVGASLEQIIQNAEGALFNNAAQAWNHTFYWKSLVPRQTAPLIRSLHQKEDKIFMNQVKADFGNIEELKRCIKECALSAFGSAWVWLVQDDLGHLRIISTSNADNPLRTGMTPLLTCDVWEHAYYIDYRNERGKYMDAFLELMNLDFASQCFAHCAPEEKQTIENRRTSYVG